MNLRTCALALLALLTLAAPALAQSDHRFVTLSGWGGAVNAFQKVGAIGYCGSGQRFVVLDMSDEANIHEIGSINLGVTVEDFVVRDNLVYLVCEQDPYRVAVLDVSNPSVPRVVWRETNPPPSTGVWRHIHLYGTLAYVDNTGVVMAYSLLDPIHPVARFTNSGFSGYDIYFGGTIANAFQIVGNNAYVLGPDPINNKPSLLICNLQPDPLHPTAVVGRVALSNARDLRGIAVANGSVLAQVTDSSYRDVVMVVDATTPAHPVYKGSYLDVFGAKGVAVQGNLAFIADHFYSSSADPTNPNNAAAAARLKGLAVLDISNPASPILLGTYNTNHSSIRDVRVEGNRAYVFCDGQGLEVLDISNPAIPTRIGNYYSPSALRLLTKDGDRLYAVDEWNGFTILDVSNPKATPTVLGVYRSPIGDCIHQGHWTVAVRNNLAYLAAGHGGFQVVDVSNPDTPTLAYQYTTGGLTDFNAWGLELDGDVLHASYFGPQYSADPNGTPWDFVANFDISSPPTIALIGQGPIGQGGRWFARLKSKQGITFLSHVAGSYSRRIDNRVPTNPQALPLPSPSSWRYADMEIAGDLLYAVNTSENKLDIYNVADPLNPTLATTYSVAGLTPLYRVDAIAFDGGRGYIGGGNVPMTVLDVTDPFAMGNDCVSTVRTALDIVADGNLAFSVLADESFGEESSARGGIVIQQYRCGADFNGSGTVTVQDLFDFLKAWFGHTPDGDYNRDLQFSVQDLFTFLSEWFAHCP